jgi:hypothetical protein
MSDQPAQLLRRKATWIDKSISLKSVLKVSAPRRARELTGARARWPAQDPRALRAFQVRDLSFAAHLASLAG